VHAREIVTREPWVVYPGNLQGRHIRETGVKGCELVSVVDGHIATTPLALDVLRWRELAVDVTGLADLDALLDHVKSVVRAARTEADGRILGLRLQLYGVSPWQAQLSARAAMVAEELRACVLEAGNGEVWLEKIQNVVRPTLDLARLASGNDPVGLLLQELAQLAINPAKLAALSTEVLADLVSKLPTEADDRDAFRVNNPALLQELLAQAQAELLDALAGAGGAA
jgi:exonuclease SbcD